MDICKANNLYIGHIDQPYGDVYAQTVGRFQENFLRDKVCADLDEAFARAVDCAERALTIIKIKAAA